jgi:hypothetical protein
VADELLEAGVTPAELMMAQGFDPRRWIYRSSARRNCVFPRGMDGLEIEASKRGIACCKDDFRSGIGESYATYLGRVDSFCPEPCGCDV